VLIERHAYNIYCRLTWYLMYDFNTVDFDIYHDRWVSSNGNQKSQAREIKSLAISLQFHISSINKLFWSEYQDRL
jgi:hypothetical protein